MTIKIIIILNPRVTLAVVNDDFYMSRLIASFAPSIKIMEGLEYKLQFALDHAVGDRYVSQKKILFVSGVPGFVIFFLP